MWNCPHCGGCALGDSEGVEVAVALAVPLAEDEDDADELAVCEAEGVFDGLLVDEGVCDGAPVALDVKFPVVLDVWVCVAPDAVPVALDVGEDDIVDVPLPLRVPVDMPDV